MPSDLNLAVHELEVIAAAADSVERALYGSHVLFERV